MSPTDIIEVLPPEILTEIFRYLDRRSLIAISQTRKSYNVIASSLLFETISLKLHPVGVLQHVVEKWLVLLKSRNCTKHVRRLVTKGDEDKSDEYVLDDALLRDFEEIHTLAPDYRSSEALPPPNAYGPLVHLVDSLPSLKDFVYNDCQILPPSLLSLLHKKLPTCRLHIKCFYLYSLNLVSTDPHEFALATSPCLTSLTNSSSSWTKALKEDHNHEAVLQMLSTYAPNLRNLSLRAACRGTSSLISNGIGSLPLPLGKPWKGFSSIPEKYKNLHRKAPLQHLKIRNEQGVRFYKPGGDFKFMDNLIECIDFSTLRSLNLEGVYLKRRTLSWMTQDRVLTSLDTLSLDVRFYDQDQLLAFFASLPRPLKRLRLFSGEDYKKKIMSATLNVICEHHGPSLRILWLDDTNLGNDQIFHMALHCPVLETLLYSVSITDLDRHHPMEIYSNLGNFPRLDHLFISLNFNPSLKERAKQVYGHTGNNTCNRFLQKANPSVNSILARKIYRQVSRRKKSRSATTSTIPLEYVELRIEEMRRKFMVKRNSRDDRREELLVTKSWLPLFAC